MRKNILPVESVSINKRGEAVVRGVENWSDWTFVVGRDRMSVQVKGPVAITREVWVALPIGSVLRAAEQRLDPPKPPRPAPIGHMPAGGSDEHDELVIRLYREAVAAGRTPRRYIGAACNVHEQTAGRWITRLRDQKRIKGIAEERKMLLKAESDA